MLSAEEQNYYLKVPYITFNHAALLRFSLFILKFDVATEFYIRKLHLIPMHVRTYETRVCL
jgi:hypothetical protein